VWASVSRILWHTSGYGRLCCVFDKAVSEQRATATLQQRHTNPYIHWLTATVHPYGDGCCASLVHCRAHGWRRPHQAHVGAGQGMLQECLCYHLFSVLSLRAVRYYTLAEGLTQKMHVGAGQSMFGVCFQLFVPFTP
jgi:hypothetical protein